MSNQMRIVRRGRWIARALLGAAIAAVAGCGNETAPPVPVDPEKATAAGAQAGQFAQLATSEDVLDAVEQPFSSAAGDLEGLGAVGLGEIDLGGTSGPALLAGAPGRLARSRVGAGVRAMRDALAAKLGSGARIGAPECNPIPGTACQSADVCVEATSEENVVVVTIEMVACEGIIARAEQRLTVDTKGTVGSDDDEIRDAWSFVALVSGLEVELSLTPISGPAIVDGARVDARETIRHPAGLVRSQTNTMEVEMGLLAVDGDEVIWDLSSQVDFRNGATASIAVAEVAEVPDGITDGDRVRVTTQFTAEPGNPRLESASTVVEVLVAVLVDPEDDLYASVQHTLVFDGSTALGGLPTATLLFVPVEPVAEGTEPCGGTLTRTAAFPAGWEAQTLQHTLTLGCDSGGSSQLEVAFADGTNFSRRITWTGSGAATLEMTGRDGTTTAGSWNRNGASASFVIDTLFPAGSDPVSVHQEGASDRAAGTRSYSIEATYADLHVETLAVQAQRTSDGRRTLTGSATTPAGTTEFALEWDPEAQQLSGSSSGPQDESGSFTLTRLEGGGATLVFTWTDPSEDLTVTGEAAIGPDGKGCGTLTVTQGNGSSQYAFCFDAAGHGFIGGAQGVPF
jgi:hypothetical protein